MKAPARAALPLDLRAPAVTATLRAPTGPSWGRQARTDRAVRRWAAVALAASTLLVVAWWVRGGGAGDLDRWTTGLLSTGRLTGLLASNLLLAQVLLMARLPWLERAFGQDRLAALHRIVGFVSFDLMVAHLVLITWGYAAGRLSRTPATLWELTVDHPGMLLAVAGAGCLVMVVVTSVRAARRRLRYESWHLLHLYGYLGVGLALPHQLWTGQEFQTSPAATVYWWTVWAGVAATVLVWRVGLPLWRSARHRLRVTAVVPEAPGVVSVHLTGRRLDRLPVRAGQFLHWRFLTGSGWTRANPFSLSAAPDGHTLRITARELGDGSALLAGLHPGTRVLVEGPYGRLTERPRTRPKLAFIGAGVGITPLRALAEAMDYAPGDAVVLQRFRDVQLFADEFAELTRTRGLVVHPLGGSRGDSWLGAEAGTTPAELVPDLADRDVYVCGPDSWVADVRRSALAAGLPARRFHVESFGW